MVYKMVLMKGVYTGAIGRANLLSLYREFVRIADDRVTIFR